jgi:mannosidase alpha-like ER degradation enhancer 2
MESRTCTSTSTSSSSSSRDVVVAVVGPISTKRRKRFLPSRTTSISSTAKKAKTTSCLWLSLSIFCLYYASSNSNSNSTILCEAAIVAGAGAGAGAGAELAEVEGAEEGVDIDVGTFIETTVVDDEESVDIDFGAFIETPVVVSNTNNDDQEDVDIDVPVQPHPVRLLKVLQQQQELIQKQQQQHAAKDFPELMKTIWETLKVGSFNGDDGDGTAAQDPQNLQHRDRRSPKLSWFSKHLQEGKQAYDHQQAGQQQQQQQQQQRQQGSPKQSGASSSAAGTATARPMVAANRRALYQHSLQQRYVTAQEERILLEVQQQQQQRNANQTASTADAWRDWINTYLGIGAYTTATATALAPPETPTTTAPQEQQQPKQRRQVLTDRSNTLHAALPPYSHHQKLVNMERIRGMFQHAYDSYMTFGWPAAEVHPLTCTPATFDLIRLEGLTVIDALDTLVVLGNYTEFARAVERLKAYDTAEHRLVAVDQNVSLFETNIRVLGGLLSAHQMAQAYFVETNTTTSATEEEQETDGGSLFVQVPKSHVWDDAGQILWGSDMADSAAAQQAKANTNTCPAATNTNTRIGALDICDSDLRSLPDCVSSNPSHFVPFSTTATGKTMAKESNAKKTCNNATRSNGLSPEDYWSYDGFLLELATDLGYRLLPAFDTNTGIPYGTVNLMYGVPAGETPVASLAGGGTLTLEFELLSRLTGDDSFGKAAKLASRALWMKRSALNLLGKHINVQSGAWTEHSSGIGSNSDSYLEYLVKHYMLFPEDPDFWTMVQSVYSGIQREARVGEWYKDVDMNQGAAGGQSRRVLESLMSFYPGMQILLGEVTPAARTLNSFFMVREFLGFLPERFHYGHWRLDAGLGGSAKHPLRPELLESCYFLHRATKDMNAGGADRSSNTTSDSSGWLWAADFALDKLDTTTRAKCGYAGVRDLKPSTSGSVDGSTEGVKLMNEMPSFFLSETLKYLYLIFDDDNILHRDNDREWIFTTEAHPIHHVPAVKAKSKWQKGQAGQLFADEILSLKTTLSYRLTGKKRRKRSSPDDLTKEKWTEHSNRKSYVDHIVTVTVDASTEAYLDRAQSRLPVGDNADSFFGETEIIKPFIPPEYAWVNTFDDTVHERNIAHLSLGDLSLGDGKHLRKACPNLYSSDLLWMQALNGGAVDYSDVYVSSTNDEFSEVRNQFVAVGAGEALGFLGTGVYLGRMDNEDESCPFPEILEKKVADATGHKTPPLDGDVHQIANEFGVFEVSPFAEGGGFYIHHIDSDTTIITSLLVDEIDGSKVLVMIDSSTNNGSISEAGQKTTPDSDREKSTADKTRTDYERSVIFADFNANSFRCEIELYQKIPSSSHDYNDNDESTDEALYSEGRLLARYPCAPALFGPTQMEQLLKTNGVSIEASVFAPVEGDEYGCKKSTASSSSSSTTAGDKGNAPGISTVNDNGNVHPAEEVFDEQVDSSDVQSCCPNENSIQILLRGECAFQTKALTQKEEWNVAATIIINSDDDELFIMSAGDDELARNAPVSVLITGLDGEALLNTMAAAREEDESAVLTARVLVKRQPTSSKEIPKEKYPTVRWPVVRGSTKKLQVFCRDGWGLQAKQDAESSEWKLNLFRHETPNAHSIPK